MPFLNVGGVFLDDVRFNTDPSPYEPLNWPRRRSKHLAIGGKTVIQDFGLRPGDNVLRLGSGSNRFMEEAVVTQIFERYKQTGATYLFRDWLDNRFMVFIENFVPVPWKRGLDQQGSVVSLHTYTMTLWTTEVIAVLGRPFGS